VIEVADQEGVAILHMADGKANAMSLEFCETLTAHFADVSTARAVIVTGTGRIFSAGVDLKRLLDGGAPYIRRFLPALRAMLAAVFYHPKPVIAAINAHAIAGGCVLACAADKRVMARDAGRIGATELLVGVPSPRLRSRSCAARWRRMHSRTRSSAARPIPRRRLLRVAWCTTSSIRTRCSIMPLPPRRRWPRFHRRPSH
jgi:hypothetical protein